MTAEFLISLLQALPPNTVVQFKVWDDSYDPPRIYAASSFEFAEERRYKGEVKEPNRIILS